MSWSFPSTTVRGCTAVPATKSRGCGAVHTRPLGYPPECSRQQFPPLEEREASGGETSLYRAEKMSSWSFFVVSITSTGIAYPNSFFWRAAHPCSLDGRAPLWRRVIPLEETESYLAGGISGVAKWPGVVAWVWNIQLISVVRFFSQPRRL